MAQMKCPIWGSIVDANGYGDGLTFVSPRTGGLYRVSGSVLQDGKLGALLRENAAKATTWLHEQRRVGEAEPLITSDVITLIAARPALSAIEKTNRALSYIASQTPTIGGTIRYAGQVDADYNKWMTETQILTESDTIQEVQALVRFLTKKGFLDQSATAGAYAISLEGWEHLDHLQTNTSNSEQAFIAMWFDASVNDAYTYGIAPAVENTGYRPLRIDNKEHINKIDDEIISEIRRSKFLIADFTSHPDQPRGGVYFEAGFAMGLKIPVIWTCREDLISKVHFDTRQYNHITWKDTDELRIKMENRIGAVLGDGPLKKRP